MKNIITREPAVILGLLAAILSALAELSLTGNLTVASAVPLVTSIVTRQFVSPAVSL